MKRFETVYIDELVDRFEEPADPTAPPGRAVRAGATSPRSKVELLELTDQRPSTSKSWWAMKWPWS